VPASPIAASRSGASDCHRISDRSSRSRSSKPSAHGGIGPAVAASVNTSSDATATATPQRRERYSVVTATRPIPRTAKAAAAGLLIATTAAEVSAIQPARTITNQRVRTGGVFTPAPSAAG
jgi:hypothetical protein